MMERDALAHAQKALTHMGAAQVIALSAFPGDDHRLGAIARKQHDAIEALTQAIAALEGLRA